MIVSVLWLFLAVSWTDLQSVIVVFPGHSHLLSVVNRVNTTHIFYVLQTDDVIACFGK